MLKPRYMMIGGFLGAGKTTAILQLARRMRDRQIRVGLITNDQSFGLVDTTMLKSHGFATEEITGGCFCCMFNSLIDASEKLTASTQPDVFLAEPVGSCTDLQATVTFPLRKMYGANYAIAPLSVVLDPIRTARVLGLERGKTFSQKVLYIFEKQLEEADVLVVNKCDLISEPQQEALQRELEKRFPQAKVLRVSARNGQGVDEWLRVIQTEDNQTTQAMNVDYDIYADGEALLGWLNLAATVSGPEFDGNEVLLQLGNAIRQRLDELDITIAHLKMTLTPDTGNDLAVGNLVRNQSRLELSHELSELLEEGELLVNLRAEGAPEILQPLVEEELRRLAIGAGLSVTMRHLESFRPGRPQPTHHLVQLSSSNPT